MCLKAAWWLILYLFIHTSLWYQCLRIETAACCFHRRRAFKATGWMTVFFPSCSWRSHFFTRCIYIYIYISNQVKQKYFKSTFTLHFSIGCRQHQKQQPIESGSVSRFRNGLSLYFTEVMHISVLDVPFYFYTCWISDVLQARGRTTQVMWCLRLSISRS